MGAGEDAVVTLAYAMPIEREPKTGTLTVNLATVLNPRYVPWSDITNPEIMSKKFHSDVEYIAVSYIPYTFTFSADIDLGVGGGNKILDIKSGNSTDKVQVSRRRNNEAATVRLTSKFSPDHDFRLIIDTEPDIETKVFAEPGLSGSTSGPRAWLSYDIAAAWFEPLGDEYQGPSTDQYWLVVDRSGSMTGDKIASAKTALIYFIKSLPEGCRFNIIGFGSRFDSVFQETAFYGEGSAKTALSYANNLDSSFGGTEILSPLKDIYSKPIPSGVERNFIIIMTDGEVSNTNQVIDLARQNADTTTVYSVGIGQGASTALVNGVARVSNGVSEYVRSSQDRLQAKVVNILRMTRMPAATNVKLEWPESGFTVIEKAPEASRTVAVQGREIAQFAVIKRNSRNVNGVSKLTAEFEGNSISFTVPFSISGHSGQNDPMPLHRLAANAKLVELKDEYYSKRDESIKREAIQISESLGVLSEFTSIVAVDESGDLVKDDAGKPLFVGIQRPTIYDMNPRLQVPVMMSGGFSPQRTADRFSGQTTQVTTTSTGLQQLINLVSTSGVWKLDESFGKAVGFPLVQGQNGLKAKLEEAARPLTDGDVLATLTGVTFFRKKYASNRDEWSIIEGKSVRYLKANGLTENEINQYVDRIATKLNVQP